MLTSKIRRFRVVAQLIHISSQVKTAVQSPEFSHLVNFVRPWPSLKCRKLVCRHLNFVAGTEIPNPNSKLGCPSFLRPFLCFLSSFPFPFSSSFAARSLRPRPPLRLCRSADRENEESRRRIQIGKDPKRRKRREEEMGKACYFGGG